IAVLNAQSEQASRESQQLRQDLAGVTQQAADLRVEIAKAETTVQQREAALREQIETVTHARKELEDAFAKLSQEALNQNNQQFIDLARQSFEKHQAQATGELEKRQTAIDELVKPLKESLQKVDEKIGDLSNVFGQQKEVTEQLVNTLKVPAQRGRFGEMTLERLFETTGLTRGVNYELQHRDVGTESTGIYDAIVYLPNHHCIVIDAKAPMDAFDRACQAATEAERQDQLREHARTVRNHVNALSKRNYHELESKPMYVLMYLPMEGLFTAAIQFDSDILKYADEKKIYLATPTTLLGFLQLCSLYWSEQKLAESAAEIRDLGAELYKRVGKVAEHMKKLGDQLNKSVDSFNAAVGSLDRNLISQARKFKELRATNADIPELESLDVKTRELQSDEFRLGSGAVAASLPLESEAALNDPGG